MPIKQFFKMILTSLSMEILLLASAILMGRWYFVTLVYSLFINIITSINDIIRPRKMGNVALKFKGERLVEILFLCSSVIPIFNIIFSVNRYIYSVCANDEEFIKKYPGKLILPAQAIKEYNPNYKKEPLIYAPIVKKEEDIKKEYEGITRHKYQFSKEMESINTYIDYIMLNKNLTKKQKEKLLKELKNNVVYNNKVNLSNKTIKKLVK